MLIYLKEANPNNKDFLTNANNSNSTNSRSSACEAHKTPKGSGDFVSRTSQKEPDPELTNTIEKLKSLTNEEKEFNKSKTFKTLPMQLGSLYLWIHSKYCLINLSIYLSVFFTNKLSKHLENSQLAGW